MHKESSNNFLNFFKILCIIVPPIFHFFSQRKGLFSAPEPQGQVHIVRRPSSLTFHIFDFSSETAEWNSKKLDTKQDLNVL